jgi:hypothetical protein
MNNHNIFLNLWYPIVIIGNSFALTSVSAQIVQETSVYQIRQIARDITVLIFTPAGSGSGTIIAKNRDQYWVLTAAHVVNQINNQEEADLQTYDGKIHLIDTTKITLFQDSDLALVTFTTEQQNYQIAPINSSEKIEELTPIFVAGYPLSGNAMRQNFNITTGNITSVDTFNNAGYDLVYTNATITGMSGGPILNQKGQLIGVHGRAEGTSLPDGTVIKAGFNLGIPISVFLQELSSIEIGNDLDLKIISLIPSDSVINSFNNFIDSHYQRVSSLLEIKDIQTLYSYLPIAQEVFIYTNRQGETQDYQTTLIKTTEYFSQSKARGETWRVSHRINDIQMINSNQAIVSFEQIVRWSLWPGLISGVTNTKLVESWQFIDNQWQIVAVEEVQSF